MLGDGRRIWPEVCIRHALGVLNDRGDLDYDTWMRLELVLEDQYTLGKIYRKRSFDIVKNMGLSENSVPLNPMVNDHYPY